MKKPKKVKETVPSNGVEVEIDQSTLGGDVIEVYSKSNPNKKYRVDIVNGRCSCPRWIFQRDGVRQPCKHLIALGIESNKLNEELKNASPSPLDPFIEE